MMPHADDERLMGLALSLGRRRLGATWPNPAVGAVVVDPASGRILGQGATAPGGRPHAETIALAAAGDAARGATLYVTLEPCSHHGRTPPCADAVAAAGIARVVSAIEDPNDEVAGRGHARLRAAGIAVVTDIRAAEAARDHCGHLLRMRLGRPAVHLKLARTADGFAGRAGARLLITGPAADARTHLSRARADAVLVGIGTALADDPRLDVRLPGLESASPVRAVLDTRLRLPPTARLLAGPGHRAAWIVCGEAAEPEAERRLRDAGAEVIRVATTTEGRVDLVSALDALAARGLTRLFCEGGPALADGLAKADLVDAATLVTGAARLDGPGVLAVGPALAERLRSGGFCARSEEVGPDRLDHYERPPCSLAS